MDDALIAAKIQRFIGAHDYKRAWNAIKAFYRQIRNAEEEEKIHNLRTLVQNLFEAMLEANLITPVTESNYMAQYFLAPFTSYDTKPRARDCRPAKQHHARVPRPGWTMACFLGYKQAERWRSDLTVEGAMILKIAFHLREKNNQERRQLHLAACEAYDRTHPATK